MRPTLKQRKQVARIFRRAAEWYLAYGHDNSDGCCRAIRRVARPLGPRARNTALDLFRALFHKSHDRAYWWEYPALFHKSHDRAYWWEYPYYVDFDKEISLYPRLNALLLAAEFAETEKDWPI